MLRPVLLIIAFLAAPAAAAAQAARVELPVREVVLSDGARRYAVPLQVEGQALEAGLDTGSTGLRLMPKALAALKLSGGRSAQSYAFGAGVRLEGEIVQARVDFGAISARVPLEAVHEIGCTAAQRACATTRVSAPAFGIQGDGLPGEGFAALLGINTATSDAANPFIAAGVRRWIVELPRPGEATAGRIILNPTNEEVAGFAFAPMWARGQGGLHDAVPGCLLLGPQTRACAPMVLDTGAPGIRARNAGLRAPAADGAPATLAIADASGAVIATESLQIGLRQHASHLMVETGQGEPAVFAGLAPYFAFSVLYDTEHQRIGFMPRTPAPGGPTGALASQK